MVTQITIQDALKRDNVIFVDTRTPKEFAIDHIPNAINIPILSNDERVLVGTLYKQVSKDEAIEKGLEFFSQKLPDFMKEINKYRSKKLVINCWRGGMRSRAIVALLESLNYDVLQLKGGYKSFREYVRERLYNYDLQQNLIVLYGLTCTGKTKLLQNFSNSIDLEGLAQHRSSIYGSVGLQPHSQKMFENLLLQKLDELKNEKTILIEGESRRIGDIMIPLFLWKKMKHGMNILIEKNVENRSKECVGEYFTSQENIVRIKEITLGISKLLSNKQKQEIVDLLDASKYQDAMRILLENYYDPLYSHTLKNVNFSYKINSDDEQEAIKNVKKIIKIHL